jgi:hypothetical protein
MATNGVNGDQRVYTEVTNRGLGHGDGAMMAINVIMLLGVFFLVFIVGGAIIYA